MLLKSFWTSHFQMMNELEPLLNWIELVNQKDYQKV